MTPRRAIIYAAIAGMTIILTVLTALGTKRIWVVYDGCECGRQRKWYQMPESIWAFIPFFRTTIKEGDPNHKHRYWDPQYVDVFPEY